MARVSIDNSGEVYGDKTSIADLACFSFNGLRSEDISIYFAHGLIVADWRDELKAVEYEYLTGMQAVFKDGSILYVAAWNEGDETRGYLAGLSHARRRDMPCLKAAA